MSRIFRIFFKFKKLKFVDQTDKWMICDTGYSLRFNKFKNLPYENSSAISDEIYI